MRKTAMAIGLVAVMTLGGTAFAAHQFIDVPESHIFHDDISWMYENGITYGYEGTGMYGPEDSVTRGQMAAFMHRLYNRIQRDIPEVPDLSDLAVEVFNQIESGGVEVIGVQGPQGPKGDKGDKGDPGKDGRDGKDGVSGYRATNRTARVGGEGDTALEEIRDGVWKATRTCPDGKVVTGGGLQQNEKTDYAMVGSYPDKYSDGLAHAWSVEIKAKKKPKAFLVWAVCVDIAS